MDNYARTVVEKFLRANGCELFKTVNNRVIWIKDDVIIIQLPAQGRIDYDYFESIALEQLAIGYAEFDLWLGENT